jgi:hypothetical protein
MFLSSTALFLLSGCGGGGGGSDNVGGTPIVSTPMPSPPPGKGWLNVISLVPVPASDLTEVVNFVVPKFFFDAHPELETNIRQIVADINAVLAKDPQNKKLYVLGQVMTHDGTVTGFSTIKTNPTFFTDNHFVGKRWDGGALELSGTTIAYWLQSSLYDTDLPSVFPKGVYGLSSSANVSGKKYGLIYVAETPSATALLGRISSGSNNYDYGIGTLLHELGHTMGLGIPEWYGLHSIDQSGVLPDLSFSYQNSNYMDPMVGGYSPAWVFAPFNSWLISHNANHQLDLPLILWAAQNNIETQVRVVDASGAPVPSATVNVYGSIEVDQANPCPYVGVDRGMKSVIQTHVTDVNGMVFLTRDAWYARGIKASRGEKVAGQVVTLIDLEDAYFRQGLTTFTVTLTLK